MTILTWLNFIHAKLDENKGDLGLATIRDSHDFSGDWGTAGAFCDISAQAFDPTPEDELSVDVYVLVKIRTSGDTPVTLQEARATVVSIVDQIRTLFWDDPQPGEMPPQAITAKFGEGAVKATPHYMAHITLTVTD